MLTEKQDKRRLCIQSSRRVNVVTNAFFVLSGALLLLVGSILMKQLADLASIYKVTLPAGVIVLGVVLIVVGIYGFVAANVDKTKYLIAYFLVLFIVIVCEFGIAGGAYTIHDTLPQRLQTSWNGLSPDDRNSLQTQYTCCGFTDPSDNPGPNCVASNTTNGNHTTNSTTTQRSYFENSQIASRIVRRDASTTNNSTLPGCGTELISLFKTAVYGIGTALVVLASFQFLGLCSSFALWVAILWDRYKTGQERVF